MIDLLSLFEKESKCFNNSSVSIIPGVIAINSAN